MLKAPAPSKRRDSSFQEVKRLGAKIWLLWLTYFPKIFRFRPISWGWMEAGNNSAIFYQPEKRWALYHRPIQELTIAENLWILIVMLLKMIKKNQVRNFRRRTSWPRNYCGRHGISIEDQPHSLKPYGETNWIAEKLIWKKFLFEISALFSIRKLKVPWHFAKAMVLPARNIRQASSNEIIADTGCRSTRAKSNWYTESGQKDCRIGNRDSGNLIKPTILLSESELLIEQWRWLWLEWLSWWSTPKLHRRNCLELIRQ